MTATDTEQLPLAGMLRPPGSVTELPPAVVVTAEPPPQVVLALGTGAITTPAGRVSTSAAVVVASVAFALVSTMVSVEIPPALIVPGVNDLLSEVAVEATTVSGALAGAGLLPFVVCNALAEIVFTYVPACDEVTLTDTVHIPLPPMMAPAGSVIVLAPDWAFTKPPPPQVVPALGTDAITTPEGKVSISAEVVVAGAGFAFVSVMVSVDVAPELIVPGLNVLLNAGTASPTTVSVATAGARLLPLEVCNALIGIVLT